MNNEPSERYTSQTACGQALVLEFFGEVGNIEKMTIGNRFFISIKCYPAQCGYDNEQVNMFFDFYRNYAPLLSWEELKHGWSSYVKASKQRSDSLSNAFWNYLDGKRITRLDRKGSVFKWV